MHRSSIAPIARVAESARRGDRDALLGGAAAIMALVGVLATVAALLSVIAGIDSDWDTAPIVARGLGGVAAIVGVVAFATLAAGFLAEDNARGRLLLRGATLLAITYGADFVANVIETVGGPRNINATGTAADIAGCLASGALLVTTVLAAVALATNGDRARQHGRFGQAAVVYVVASLWGVVGSVLYAVFYSDLGARADLPTAFGMDVVGSALSAAAGAVAALAFFAAQKQGDGWRTARDRRLAITGVTLAASTLLTTVSAMIAAGAIEPNGGSATEAASTRVAGFASLVSIAAALCVAAAFARGKRNDAPHRS